MNLWIVIPVYNDAPSVTILHRRLLEVLEGSDLQPRFVLVDDTAGQDPGIEVVGELDDVHVLEPPFNLGHQRAIVYGLRRIMPSVSDDDYLVTLDGDGEDQPADLPRLLEAVRSEPHADRKIALALRTKRRESLRFKVMYLLFRILFRVLTGTRVRSGNFAAMPGALARRALAHPTFDLSYSAAILALDMPTSFVPCERGERYEGRSKMTLGRLAMHGLRMLMPFTDRIAIRALAIFVASLVLGVALAIAVVGVKLFSGSAPEWATFAALAALMVSLVALGNFVNLFVLFSQTRAVSLASIEEGDPPPVAVQGAARVR